MRRGVTRGPVKDRSLEAHGYAVSPGNVSRVCSLE